MKRRVWLILAILVLGASAILLIVALLPSRWFQRSDRQGPVALSADAIIPTRSHNLVVPKGARVEPSGYLTIVDVPPTPAQPKPRRSIPAAVNSPPPRPIPTEVAAGIRLFARLRPQPPSSDSVPRILVAPPQQMSRVILRDGCFRLAERGEPLAVFTLATRLIIDDQGYLAFTASVGDGPMRARIGESVWWEGERRQLKNPREIAAIRARCGPGQVQVIGLAQSVSLAQSFADGQAATRVSEMYGIPRKRALAEVRECRAQVSRGHGGRSVVTIYNPCGSTPPPPVPNRADCPSGTTLSGGLCRTPDGYVRPIPEWLTH